MIWMYLSVWLGFAPVLKFAAAADVQEALELPKIEISFPDVGDKDFSNETFALMTNSNPVFEMLCTASYPVEWIFHYNLDDDGNSENTKLAETHRITDDFLNLSSYIYTAKIRLEYKGKILSLANFTCKSVQNLDALLETHVIMDAQDQKALITLEISNEPLGKPDWVVDQNATCDRAIAKIGKQEGDIEPCWICGVPGSEEELELDYEDCLTPIQCGSTYTLQNKGKSCVQTLENVTDTCKYGNGPNFNPKIILCKNRGPALAQFYFFGVFKGDSYLDESIPGPPIFFDWTDIDPKEMIYIHPMSRDIVYLGQETEFTCEYSRYYFSLGSWIGIEDETGMKYVKPIDIKPCDHSAERTEMKLNNCTITDNSRGTYRAKLKTNFDWIGHYKIFCFGPVWNSTEWINDSLSFNVENGEKPTILSMGPEENKKFVVGQLGRKLICKFSGKPIPVVTWSGPSNETNYHIFRVNDYVSLLTFVEIGFQTKGKYTCSVTSYLGTDTKSFQVHSHAANEGGISTPAIIGISAGVFVLAAVTVLIIFRMRRIIQSQREALRLLTEAEIEEFVQGNPELLKRTKDDYFDKPAVIEALPYDSKYEIPVDNLVIDYSAVLGSGEFGIVVKGKVGSSNASHYVRLNEDSNSYVTFPDYLDVAIKICKGNLDVQNFKALLTEIKVMAYLGSHDNIVSLIGASTENIRNRELYIVVEFCVNGSLDMFLRRHKHTFDNALNNPGENYGDTKQLTLRNLYIWTVHIAEGLDYIHSRKIIHADLAIRNILLTADWTAKIGDFGLSRQLVESSSYTKTTKCALPWRNMAIESLRNLEFSVKSDMWSFGVTLWELFTLGDVPYPGLSYTVEFVNLLEQGLRLYKPPFASNAIYDYMLMCWNSEPEDRAVISDVKVICSKILNQPT